MSITEWAGLAVAIFTLIGGFATAVRWLVKHYLYELKPNSGSSIRDKVDVNTERLTRVEERVDAIYLLLANKEK